MDVSVIIVTYNTKEMTLECIKSIFQHTSGISYEVILVDNGSTDGSKELFNKLSNITYIYSEENLGFGKANNLGYKYASGDYILLLNSDTLLLNNALFFFYEEIIKQPKNIGCLGTILVSKDNIPMHSYGFFPTISSLLVDVIRYSIPCIFKNKDLPDMKKKYPLDVDYITGADLFIRRNIIEQCGLFDPDFFMYYEETEMQYRYSRNGYKSFAITSPHIMHLQGASGKKKEHSLNGHIINIKSRLLYCRKIFSYKKYLLVKIMHLLLFPKIILCRAEWREKIMLMKIILK